MRARFTETATWHEDIISHDNEERRQAVKGIEFRCFVQTQKVRGVMSVLDGVSGKTATLTLQTDDERVKDIEANHFVEYDGYTYNVVSVGAVRSLAYKGAREYLIGLN